MSGFWKVALPAPFRVPLDYAPITGMTAHPDHIGCRVQVPLGKSIRIGFIVDIVKETSIPLNKVKAALALLDAIPIFNKKFLALLQWASQYYHAPLGEVLLTGLPASLRKGKPYIPSPMTTHPLTMGAPLLLTEEQAHCVNTISAAYETYRAFLLYGLTGSGKTEVYLQSIVKILSHNAHGQVLVLVPEIGLTPQTVARFRSRFGTVGCYHSVMTDKQRSQLWKSVACGEIRIVIGTRSALFLPFHELSYIIIDEEHDPAFKQQEGFRYHARDLAMVRAHALKIPIVLGTATPSFESLHHIETGRIDLLRLTARIGNAKMPSIQLLDVRHKQLTDGLSAQLQAAIHTHTNQKNQVLLFLNRRGYAPSWMCFACGWLAPCPRCEARLTVHAKPPALSCHHCGYKRGIPSTCPQCEAATLNPVGLGTERLEHSLEDIFPDLNLLRMDSDTTQRKGALEQQLAAIQSGEAQVLIGTQMLTKGHHFPNVTLVGIVDADSGLFSSDFRAVERMGQLITQVAGRAGREEKMGTVIIQTAQPQHPTLKCLIEEGYMAFAQRCMEERRLAKLPPFSYLALLRAEAPNTTRLITYLEAMIAYVQPKTPVQIQGPMMAPMAKRAGAYRAQLLLMTEQRAALHQALNQLCHYLVHIKAPPRFRWSLDIDPIDMS